MRTTVTLDPDVDALVKRAQSQRGVSFKRAVNDGLRRGLQPGASTKPYRLKPAAMGEPLVPLEKALQIAADMEDEAITEKMRQRR
jgi:hypothetical protein